jgi:hypothetical protein
MDAGFHAYRILLILFRIRICVSNRAIMLPHFAPAKINRERGLVASEPIAVALCSHPENERESS